MRLGLIHDPLFRKHAPPEAHPENPGRLEAIDRELKRLKLLGACELLPLCEATDAQLLTTHAPEYLEKLRLTQTQEQSFLDADTYVGSESYRVARIASGSVLAAVERLVAGKLDKVLALLRPPGHHALAERAMGFCLLNHAALAANWARSHGGLQRVAIVDWDVHHGNGTEAIFYREPQVLYISTHQYPFYPGTGAPQDLGKDAGYLYNLNFPLPAGLAENEVLALYDQWILPTLQRFAPQLLIVSAGFDAHRDDPLGQQRLSSEGFARLTALMEHLKNDNKDLKTLYLLEGGYNPASLAASVAAVTQQLLTPPPQSWQILPITLFHQALRQSYPKEILEHWGW